MKTAEIACGDYSALINLSRGANCISLINKKYGAHILREPTCGDGEPDNPYLYGMPILFPVNRISGGSFEFEGRIYRFPVNEPDTGCHLHGELHRTEFDLLELSKERVLCRYRADRDDPYLSFPHEFEIRMEYSLAEDGLTHRTEVINHSEHNMPCMLGFHTTFNSLFAGDGDVRVRVDIAEEYERNMQSYLPTGRKLAFDNVTSQLTEGQFSPFGTPISRHYRMGGEGIMTLTNYDKGLRVVYENDDKYTFRLIYNGNADGYICLEPQTCLANAPNSPFGRTEAGFDVIEPRKSKTYISKIYMTEEDEK
ncbi:MAG: aldose 1-epimerase [Clostridia bacterium]|nr:aldose 1-epimerase [Clostridia bacterium]